ncbi:glutathione S-transferase theta-3-like [Scomber japonicus]|uniref:glutathione S-transferase theta-3-like n=1 Tax=Scomber japonicus TaxID=13676 RepID=UPI0023054550|nr:glutathione S-transferase theta-3-like [Scomber japonicus]
MMELYLDLLSQPCRSVYMFAKAAGIPFEFKLVSLTAGQQHSEEFGKVSMMKKVPALKDGSFVLTESVAILKYLAEKHASTVADHWYPADLQQRARVNEYLAWQHTTIRAQGSKVFLLRTMYGVVMGCDVPKEKMDAAVEDLNQSLTLLEEKFIGTKAFIASDKISVADVVAIVEIMQPVGTGLNLFETRPKLNAWAERVKKQLGVKLFDEAHEGIMKAKSLSQAVDAATLEMMKPYFKKMFG